MSATRNDGRRHDELRPVTADPSFLEQPHGAVHRGDRDASVQRRGAPVQLLDIGMVGRVGEHARDDPALAGHLEAALHAQALDPAFHQAEITGGRGASANRRCRPSSPQPVRRPYLRTPRGLVPRPIRLASDERWLA